MNMLTDHTVVTGLMAQRLIKKLCNDCKVPLVGNEHRLKPSQVGRYTKIFGQDLEKVHIAGDGCTKCHGKGHTGRTALAEVIVTDGKFMRFFREHDKDGALAYWRKELKGISLVDHALMKIREGLISPVHTEKFVALIGALPESA